jgi:Bacterial SH3 domain
VRRRRFLGSIAAACAAAAAAGGRGRAWADLALASGSQATVTTDGVNMRGGPGSGQPIVGNLPLGATVDLLAPAADGLWWRVAGDVAVGYVSAQFLQATGAPSAAGVVDVDLAVPYAAQQTAVWCDPADIQMWLGYRQGSGGGPSASLQASIWDWETAHNAGYTVDQWDCSPFAVASAAHHWMPDAGFDHFVYDDPLAGSRLLAYLLANPAYREPSIVLIWRGLHYVLVRGVRAIGDPGRDPSGAQLLGFYVADPDTGASFWLGQDRFVPIDRWLNELFTPVSYLTPHTGLPGDPWQNRCVAIQRSWSADGPTAAGQRNATPASYA